MNRVLDAQTPIVAAPMAGGPSTPALVAAVHDAGGTGFLAAGYKTPEALADEIAQVRDLGGRFGVNLFVPDPGTREEASRRARAEAIASSLRAYAERLRPDAEVLGVELDPTPVIDDDAWDAKVALLLADPVAWVSFTFGLPDADVVHALQGVGTRVLATVTSDDEAAAAQALGVDALIAQGSDAGGHSAVHDPRALHDHGGRLESQDTAGLCARLTSLGLPVWGAGGVDGPQSVARILDAGAEAVVVGTLFLRTPEAGTSATYRRALADPSFSETVLTHDFTGRPARALRNAFLDAHLGSAPAQYPAVHHLTRPLRAAAAAAGDPQRLHLWAGAGWREARDLPAGEVVSTLASA